MAMALKEGYHVGEQMSDDPLVQVIDDFVTETERHHIIRLTADKLDTALVSAVGASKTSDGRTGSVAWVKHDQTPIVRGLVKRVSNLVGIPVRHAESLQVVHYGETQEYKPHFDAYDMNTEKGKQRTERGGQRIVTALMYLNEVEDGGGTIFPRLDLEVEAQPGRMVIFHNLADRTLTDMTRHPKSLHGGSPVWGGQKWACNLWFRAQPYQQKPTRQVKLRTSCVTPEKRR
jgi:prolyl 4-hydroxylase